MQDAFDEGREIEVGWRIGGGNAISMAGASSVAECLVSAAVPYEGASLDHISVRELSNRRGFFRGRDMSSGDWPNWK